MKTASRTRTHTHTPQPTSLSTQTTPKPDPPFEDGGQPPLLPQEEQAPTPTTHLPPTPPPPHPPHEGPRPKRRASYFPAPKSRKKSWERERGPRGFVKRKKEEEEGKDHQQPTPTPRADEKPLERLWSVCAFCLGAPTGASCCSCPPVLVSYTPPRSSLCAFCLGAPSGAYCTCNMTLLAHFATFL